MTVEEVRGSLDLTDKVLVLVVYKALTGNARKVYTFV